MYYAHYDREAGDETYQVLREHLQNVSKSCGERVASCVSFGAIKNDQVIYVAKILGGFHDFGKYLMPFQRYLVEGKASKYKDHAHISALLAYGVLSRKYLPDKKHPDNMCLNFLAYLACRLHHGNLTLDLAMLDEKGAYLKKQAQMLESDRSQIVSDFSSLYGGAEEVFSMLDVEGLQKDKIFNKMAYHIRTRLKSERWYFLLCYIFSLLIDSDKMDSADVESAVKKSLDPQIVADYIRSKSDGADINDRRNEARLSIRRSVEELEDKELVSEAIYTITAPTGIGKTLSSLDAAITMACRLESIYGYRPAIIGAIPFINIIEQTRKDYEAVFGDGVMVNHGLEDIIKGENIASDQLSKLEEKSVEENLLRVESWDSQVVLTTFVQFFHSVFTSRNKALKKMNRIAGSIVILDEVQSIPEDLLPVVGASIHFMSKFFGTRFILMTATKPKIVEFANKLLGKDEMKSIELLKDQARYFESLDRTRLLMHLDKRMSVEDLVSMVLSKSVGQQSALVVLNTIKSSVDFYRRLSKDSDFDGEVLYLSTNIVPKKRMEVIEKASSYLESGTRFIMVSTQTIEAGVDLDFDMAFRDISPLSSIIQVAGRVNRKGQRARKDVHVFRLENEAKRVYKLHHIENTVRLLESRGHVNECDYGKLVDEYYEGLLANPVSDLSRRIWEEGVMKLDFGVVEEFQMIDSDGQVMDVFVECDGEASKLADGYEELAIRMKEIGRKKDKCYYHLANRMKDIRRKMSRYMVSVRTTRIRKNRPERFSARKGIEARFLWIPPEELERLYDDDTGYIFENGDVLMF